MFIFDPQQRTTAPVTPLQAREFTSEQLARCGWTREETEEALRSWIEHEEAELQAAVAAMEKDYTFRRAAIVAKLYSSRPITQVDARPDNLVHAYPGQLLADAIEIFEVYK